MIRRSPLHRAFPAMALLAGFSAGSVCAQHSDTMRIGIEQQDIDTLMRRSLAPHNSESTDPRSRMPANAGAARTDNASDKDSASLRRLRCESQPGIAAAAWKCQPNQ